MTRRLDDLAVEALRDGRAAGETVAALAERHGISERHVRRLTAGVEIRPRLAVDPDATVETAVKRFLAGVERTARDDVRARVALSLAARLDRADTRAAPALARSLVDVSTRQVACGSRPTRSMSCGGGGTPGCWPAASGGFR